MKYLHKEHKTLTALFLCFCIIITSLLTGYNVSADEELMPEHIRLEGYEFNINIQLNGKFNQGDYTLVNEVPVTVYMGDFEPINTTMTVTGQSRNVGFITGIPVYIINGTQHQADGGDNSYLTSDGFYRVEVAPTINDGFYSLYYGGGDSGALESTVVLTKDESELIWTAATSASLNIKERETSDRSYIIRFLVDKQITSFPFSNDSISLRYEESENTYDMVAGENTVKSLGNSEYNVEFNKVPVSDEISNSLRYKVNFYRDGDKTYRIYNGNSLVYDGFSPSSQNYKYVHAKDITSAISYVENTSINGTIYWMDGGEDALRLSSEEIKSKIKVYVTGGEYTVPYELNINKTSEKYAIDVTPIDDTNQMSVEIKHLPLYDSKGNALHYFYKFDTDTFPAKNDSERSYLIRYNNTTTQSSTTQAFSGAKIYMQLTKKTSEFKLNVQWKDDDYNNPHNEAREAAISEDISLYLWRYAGNVSEGQDPTKNASPVYDERGDQYFVSLSDPKKLNGANPLDDEFTIDIAKLNWNLPNYNENGHLYHYYLTPVETARGYDVSVNSGKPYMEAGDFLTITRVGKQNVIGNVDWTKASGEKDYVGTKTELSLQRRLKENGDWEFVKDETEKNITALTPASSDTYKIVSAQFSDVDKYDKDGKTYEFRVVETGFDPEGNTDVVDSTWNENDSKTSASSSFNYKGHGYEVNIDYSRIEENQTVCDVVNKLSQIIPFTFYNTFSYEPLTKDQYDPLLERLLAANPDNGDSGFNKPIEYTFTRNKEDYFTIHLTGNRNANEYEFIVEYVDGTSTYTGWMKSSTVINDNGKVTGRRWTFPDIPLPKYDEAGKKYSYSLRGEGAEGESHIGEHDELLKAIKEIKSGSMMRVERDSDTVKNTFSVNHLLTEPGINYNIRAIADWVDNLTDPASREVEVHIIAMKKDGDKYYLYDDMSIKQDDKSPRASALLLNTANEFSQTRYFNPYRQNELISINSENSVTVEDVSELFYTAVEYSLTYKDNIYYFPFYDYETKEINLDYILTNSKDMSYEVPIETEGILVKQYPYDVKVTNGDTESNRNHLIQVVEDGHSTNGTTSQRMLYNHSLSKIKGDIAVEVNWEDDSNSSEYRQKGYKLVLGRRTSTGVDSEYNEEFTVDDWKDAAVNVPEKINKQAIRFENVDLYDDKGQPYQYFVKQYLVDAEGDLDLINEDATEYTTKNYYYTTKEEEFSSSGTGKDYKQNTKIIITNRASNTNYSTEFYIVWHDEAAYNANARADMNYALYRTEGTDALSEMEIIDPKEYTSVIKTADTHTSDSSTVAQNPFFQKIEFSGLREFDAGIKYHYFLKETKLDKTESIYNYHISFYREKQNSSESNKLVAKEYVKDEDGVAKSYLHREFDDNVTGITDTGEAADNPDNPKFFIGEHEVIINSIEAKLNIQGVKKWINVPDNATKPECTIYLYRSSVHDKLLEKPDSESGSYSNIDVKPGSSTYLDKTGLDDDTLGFSFKNDNSDDLKGYEKYDKYGATYEYEIAEFIASEDGHSISTDIMAATSDGSQLLTNKFDPSGNNKRTIYINKKWYKDENTEYEPEDFATSKPFARFYVYRIECNYLKADETIPKAEEVSLEEVKSKLNIEGYGSYEKYLAGTDKTTGKKNAELISTVYLEYGQSKELRDLNIYSPGGKPYIYFVVEDTSYVPSYLVDNLGGFTDDTSLDNGFKLAENVVMVSNQTADVSPTMLEKLAAFFGLNDLNEATVTFKNALQSEKEFLTIKGSVKWNEGLTNIKGDVRPSSTEAKEHLTLKVQRYASTQDKEKNPIPVEDVYSYDHNSESIEWEVDEDDDSIWNYTITGKFPNYAENGNPFIYRVNLTHNSLDGRNSGTNYAVTANNPSKTAWETSTPGGVLLLTNVKDGVKTNPIQNTLRGTYEVRKAWNDGYDAYELRPSKVVCMFEYLDPQNSAWTPLRYDVEGASYNGQVITVEMTKASGWKAKLTTFPVQQKDSVGNYQYRLVELAIGTDTRWNSVTNFAQISSTNYTPNVNGSLGALNVAATTWDYPAAGSGNYAYEIIGEGNEASPYSFRSSLNFGSYVVEPSNFVIKNGVAVSSPEVFTSGNNFSTDTSKKDATCVVRNILDKKTGLTITKHWDDDKNSFGTRPNEIWLMVQSRIARRYLSEGENGPVYEDVEETDDSWKDLKVVKFDAKDGTRGEDYWVGTLNDLPVIVDNNEMAYRVLECSKKYTTLGDKTTIEYVPIRVNKSESGFNILDSETNPNSLDNYKLTGYSYIHSGDGNDAVTLSNTIQSEKNLSIDKDWIIADSTDSGDTKAKDLSYTSTVLATLYYGTGDEATTLSSEFILNNADYTHSWPKLPSFVNNNVGNSKNLTKIEVKETKINGKAVAYTDSEGNPFKDKSGKNIGICVDDTNNTTWVVATTIDTDDLITSAKITNTPLKNHNLAVNYDTTTETTYLTRPDKATYELQYRFKGDSDWKIIDDSNNTSFKNALISDLEYKDITLDASGTEGDAYSHTVENLPAFGNDEGAIKEYEYRFVEIKTTVGTTNLETAYDSVVADSIALSKINGAGEGFEKDRAHGGYTYSYNNSDSQTTLTKSLLKVKIEGQKVWDDINNKYNTRASLPEETLVGLITGKHQTSLSDINVSIYKGSLTEAEDTTITWEQVSGEGNENKWKYSTQAVFPKYQRNSNTPEIYSVKETKKDSEYDTVYASSDYASLAADGFAPEGDGNAYTVSDITNKLKRANIQVQKEWENEELCTKLGIAQKDITYTLQVSTGGSSYKDLEDKDNNPIRLKLEYSDKADGITLGEFKDIPLVNSSGASYSYRIIETGMNVTINGIPVSYELDSKLLGLSYSVKESVNGGTTVNKSSFLQSTLSGNDSYSYAFGPFTAAYSKSEDIYKFKNTTITASVGADISFSEKLVGSTAIDKTLKDNFRPDSTNLVVQRKTTDSDIWSDVPDSVTGNSKIEVSLSDTTKDSFTVAKASVGGGKLPIFVVEEGEVKEYEYRIVEESIGYASSNRDIAYTGGINSDYNNSNILEGLDTKEGKSFYKATNSNLKTGYDYTSTIANNLCSNDLVNIVNTKLTGKISWYDNDNELGKRPDESGIDMILRAQITESNTVKLLSSDKFNLGNTAKAASGSVSLTTSIADDSDNNKADVTISWTKTEGTVGVWNYEITGLPLYDNKGNYITYSICHDKDNRITDYNSLAATGETGQNADSNKEYAFGLKKDIKNAYGDTDKVISMVDFDENMTTELIVTKTWNDEGNTWETRPEKLSLYIQSREVEVSGDTLTPKTEWKAAFSPEEEFNPNLVGKTGNNNYISIDKTYVSSTDSNKWIYTEILPQYKISGDTFTLIQYRAVEIGQEKNNGAYVLLTDPIEEGDNRDNTPHIASYLLGRYETDWDNGHSLVEIENELDKRADITVKKEWNTTSSDTTASSVTVELAGYTYSGHNHTQVSMVHERLQKVLDNSNWEYTYKNLPKYDMHFNEIEWEISEIKVGDKKVSEVKLLDDTKAGKSEDGKWLATYKKKYEDSSTDSENDKILLTVVNTPATGAKLAVSYNDDKDNYYSTRFDNTQAVLQYRIAGSDGKWSNLTPDLMNLVISENGAKKDDLGGDSIVSIDNSNDTYSGSYVYTLNNLPIYEAAADDSKRLEYRIIEIKQGDILLNYTDAFVPVTDSTNLTLSTEANGGYSYTYSKNDKESDLLLNKSLLTTDLSASKIWDDENNAYGTRPNKANGDFTVLPVDFAGKYKQNADSEVKVIVKEASKDNLAQPDIYWTTDDTGNWGYQTSALPKYKANSNSLAVYSVEEDFNSPMYKDPVVNSDNSLKNSLQGINVIAKKTWYNTNNNAPAYDVTFKLYRKAEDEEDYSEAPSYYVTKTLSKSDTDKKVVWENLPKYNAQGKALSYKVEEITTNDNYKLERTAPVTSAEQITYEFINIELTDHKVNKIWHETIKGVHDNNGTYKATIQLQQKIGVNGTWTDVIGKVGDITTSYDDTKRADADTNPEYTEFTKLPLYNVDGTQIFYRGKETAINDMAVEEYHAYTIEYDYSSNGKTTTITNSLNESDIIIKKTDGTSKEVMSDVEFSLYKAGDLSTSIKTVLSDSDGKAEFNIIEPGDYVIREKRVQGYEQYEDVEFSVTLNDYHTTRTFEVKNVRKLGTLNIYKKDTDGPLDGVEFKLYEKDTSGNIIEQFWKFITGKQYIFRQSAPVDSSGVTTITNIPWGEYYIVESTENDGYILTEDEYKFTVDSVTVESPINLQAKDSTDSYGNVTGNEILNYKNEFKFQKQSINGTVLHGGGYALVRKEAGVETEVKTFTIPDSDDFVVFSGIKKGDYVFRENTAPTGYRKADDVSFSIDNMGNLSSPYNDTKVVIMKDMPIASLTVTKEFINESGTYNDGLDIIEYDFREIFRPDSIKLQLYSYEEDKGIDNKVPVGTPVTIETPIDSNTFTYTYDNLPMYTSEAKALKYVVEESDIPTFYNDVTVGSIVEADTPGVNYTQKITNGIDVANLTKITVEKVADEATSIHAKFDMQLFIGTDVNDLRKTADFTLKKDESKVFVVPTSDYYYKVVESIKGNEDGSPEYEVKYINADNGIRIDVDSDNEPIDWTKKVSDVPKLTVDNKRIIYTKIENNTDTTTESTGNVNVKPGGSIAVAEYIPPEAGELVAPDSTHESSAVVDFKEGMFCVYWICDTENYWEMSDSFSINYSGFIDENGNEKEGVITILGFIDEDGNVRPKEDTCYDELREIYKDFEIKNENNKVMLYLSNSEEGLPYKNDIQVEFLPTVSAINLTDSFAGGQVSVDGGAYRNDADGAGIYGENRYVNKTVILAKAEDGYSIDLKSLFIKNAGELYKDVDIKPNNRVYALANILASIIKTEPLSDKPLDIGSDYRFETRLPYTIGSQTLEYVINGRISVTKKDENDNPIEVMIALEGLKLPLDVGVSFIKIEKNEEPDVDPTPEPSPDPDPNPTPSPAPNPDDKDVPDNNPIVPEYNGSGVKSPGTGEK